MTLWLMSLALALEEKKEEEEEEEEEGGGGEVQDLCHNSFLCFVLQFFDTRNSLARLIFE